MLDRLTAHSFAPHEGTDFTVHLAPDVPIHLRLTTVTRFPLQPHAPRPEPFSLEFVGPAAPLLPQAIYPLEHPDMGDVDLFLVPLGPGPGGGVRYEAVFN
jgi:hypothetical protein